MPLLCNTPLSVQEIEELEKSYNLASLGTGTPNLIMVLCQFCGETHTMVSGKNDCCPEFIAFMEKKCPS